ncbi:MAG: hypothetical protein ACJ8OJ_01250 [Povalibacter sp.]
MRTIALRFSADRGNLRHVHTAIHHKPFTLITAVSAALAAAEHEGACVTASPWLILITRIQDRH